VKTNRKAPASLQSTVAVRSIALPKRLMTATRNTVERPTKKKVIPPKNPRFSTLVASAKQDKVDGNPHPNEVPTNREISRLTGIELFGTVVNAQEARTPESIHMNRNSRLERGRNRELNMAEKAIAAYSATKRPNISA